MSVHDVDMDNAAAARRRPFDLIRQVREVGRQYRRCKFNQINVRNLGSDLERFCGNSSTYERGAPGSRPYFERQPQRPFVHA